jgi:hypothetical protein
VAFGVVCIRNVSSQVVELSGADRTYGGSEGGRGGGGDGGMVLGCGVAGGSLECGEPGGEGDVEEGDGGEGEELVVGLHEEV